MTTKTLRLLPLLLLPAASGCVGGWGLKPESSPGIDAEVSQAEKNARESRTLSHLAALELAVSDYIKAEGRIPPKLEALVPKFAAEVPSVDLGVKGHRETADAVYYPSDVIRDGAVDGTRIKDSGRWGFVHNDRQVIIFVDCTHKSSRGRPWYKERGVF